MVNRARSYDLIGYGDEVPGVLALVAAVREYRRRTGGRRPRTLLMAKGNTVHGVGGHLVRGQLSYLDRSHVAPALRQKYGLGLFGEPAVLYREFLQRAGVQQIALDWQKASGTLRAMLSDEGIDLLDRVRLGSVRKTGQRLDAIELVRGETYTAKQWIDSTVQGELARAAGATMTQGFGYFGLPESTLPITLVFETQGLSVDRLRTIEQAAIARFLDPNDATANQYLRTAATGPDGQVDWGKIQYWRSRMRDGNGNPMTFYQSPDAIDVRCPALSILYHAYRRTKLDLETSKAIIDTPNIAVLPGGRLSWNSLLGFVTGSEADAIARDSSLPPAWLLREAQFVKLWLENLGASSVTFAPELYVRYAGSLVDAVQPLSGAQMLAGGVSSAEALGTFSYRFDVRGGIPDLGAVAATKGYSTLGFLTAVVPTLNFGIRHAFSKQIANVALVSPASGYAGIAPAAGRIVELNAGVGQGVGIAAGIALASGRELTAIANREVVQVQTSTGTQPKIYGQGYGASRSVGAFEVALRDLDGTTGGDPLPPKDDIAGHWSEAFIEGLKAAAVVKGFPDGTFRPDRGLTRAEFASMLMAAFGDRPDRQGARSFSDVPTAFWGASAIAAIARKGFLSGFPDGTFRPNDPLTRTQALLALASGLDLGDAPATLLNLYADRDAIPGYARPAVAAATERRLVVNHPHRDRLEPNRAIVRGEVCAFLYQALTAVGEVPAIASDAIVNPTGALAASVPASDDVPNRAAVTAEAFISQSATINPTIPAGEFDAIASPSPTTAKDAAFPDTAGHWAADYINALAAAGIVSGSPDGKF